MLDALAAMGEEVQDPVAGGIPSRQIPMGTRILRNGPELGGGEACLAGSRPDLEEDSWLQRVLEVAAAEPEGSREGGAEQLHALQSFAAHQRLG